MVIQTVTWLLKSHHWQKRRRRFLVELLSLLLLLIFSMMFIKHLYSRRIVDRPTKLFLSYQGWRRLRLIQSWWEEEHCGPDTQVARLEDQQGVVTRVVGVGGGRIKRQERTQ